MAYKSGTPVQPGLLRMDFSPIARGGEAFGAGIGQGLAALGQGIGQAKERKRMQAEQNKQIDAAIKSTKQFLETDFFKQTATQLGIPTETLDQLSAMMDDPSMSPLEKAAFGQQLQGTASGIVQQWIGMQGKAPPQADLKPGDLWVLDTGEQVREVFDPATGKIGYSTESGFKPMPTTATKYEKPTGGADPVREQKIKDLMTAGLNRVDAVDVVDGNKRIVTNPVTGESTLFNLRDNSTDPIRLKPDSVKRALDESTKPPEGAPAPAFKLWDMASKTTGFVPGLLSIAQRATGQVGINVADPEVQENMQIFEGAKQSLVRALALSQRFNASEMETIRAEIDINPAMFKDEQTMLAQMRGVDAYLRDRLMNELAVANDPEMPADGRKNAMLAASSIQNFLRILGVPQGTARQSGGVPDGVDPELWEYMDEEQRSLWK